MSLLEKLNLPEDIKRLTNTELSILAKEIRQKILDTVISNGGHLSSNLGVVELTLALYRVFDMPKDKLIFDVGHQCYTHKIISGRLDNFKSLRLKGGLSGFPKREESGFDVFNTGHSSSALSIACGLMRGRKLSKENYEIISVIGDGSLTGGLIYEALNDSGSLDEKQIIILNDNSMSISKNVGAMSKYLSKLHDCDFYHSLYGSISKNLKREIFLKNGSAKSLCHLKRNSNYEKEKELPFSQFNLKYYGPINGHDFNELINVFNIAKKEKNSVIIHVITQKGKGYLPAEINPDKYHGVSKSKSNKKTFSEILGKKLTELAEKDSKIVAVTAAMADGTGLSCFQDKFPERFIDVGIAEAHAVTMSAALSLCGLKPYFAVYSSFLQRGFDELLLDVCMQNLPVTFCIDRAGVVGQDGETHQGIFDLSYLLCMPNLTICAPKDTDEFEKLLDFSLNFNAPLAIRYPKGSSEYYKTNNKIELSKWEILKGNPQNNIVLLAVGARMVNTAMEIYELFKKKGIDVCVVNCLFVKPLDKEFLNELNNQFVFTLEDNVLSSGFGSSVATYICNNSINCKLHNFAFPDTFLYHANTEEIFKDYNLDSHSIFSKISEIIE